MSVTDLLGGELPEGTSISIKRDRAGSSALKGGTDGGGNAALRQKEKVLKLRDLYGATSDEGVWAPNAQALDGRKVSSPKNPDCPSGQHWDNNIGQCVWNNPFATCPEGYQYDASLNKCVPITGEDIGEPAPPAEGCPPNTIWDPNIKQCVVNFNPFIGNCPEGYYWDAAQGRCIPARGAPPDTRDEMLKALCEADGGTYDPETKECIMPPKEPTEPVEPVEPTEPVEPPPTPPPPPDHTKVVPPADLGGDTSKWMDYYSTLSSGAMETEMQYWRTQEDLINRTYDRGLQEIKAKAAHGGFAYGTEMEEIEAIYTTERKAALDEAYSEIMYTGLQRRMEQQKMAMDFFTDNKSLDLTYALQRGELELSAIRLAIEEKLGWAQIGISQQELEIAMVRATTERVVALARVDQDWATIYSNFMALAIQVGMTQAEAEEFYMNLMATYGASEESGLPGG